MTRVTFSPRTRSAVLDASAGKCAYCGADLTDAASFAIDHVEPLSRGGADSISNLVAACQSCNSSKHDKPLLEFLITRPPVRTSLGRMKTLKEHREAAGLSMRAFAAQAGVSTRTIVLAESGRQEPYPATMRRMAAALGVRVLEITEFARAVEYNEPDAAAPK